MPWKPIWVDDIAGPRNSQHPFDPYSFTHVDHGILMYMVFGGSDWWRFLLCVALEIAWEVFENSSYVIDKFRSGGASPNYKGDAFENNVGDILSCTFGYILCLILPWTAVASYVITSEIILTLLIRDSLFLIMIQLAVNLPQLKAWQAERLKTT